MQQSATIWTDRLRTGFTAKLSVPHGPCGYGEIWLVGVSMGGLGAFFHERAYPAQVTGLILLAPFVGDDRKLLAEIDAAGGAVAWACFAICRRCEAEKGGVSEGALVFPWPAEKRSRPSDLDGVWRSRPSVAWNRALTESFPGRASRPVAGRAHLGSLDPGFTEILAKIGWDRTLPDRWAK